MPSTTILPGKFDTGHLEAWLREFDACAAANGWKMTDKRDEKILKLPVFLRGKTASHFYAVAEEQRKTFATATAELKRAMCPTTHRENFCTGFESPILRPSEDPTVYRW